MSLMDCPFDDETGLWVIRSAWLPTTCQRCNCYAPSALVELGDHNAGLDMTKYLCNECMKHYIKLPKKETT